MQNTQQPAPQMSPSQQSVTPRSAAPQMPANHTAENGQLRRFCYVIELKTIRAYCDIHLPKDIFVYAKLVSALCNAANLILSYIALLFCIFFRYVYPLFGTTNPIMTLPPVRLSTTEDKHFSQGFCAFELAADFAEVSWVLAVLLKTTGSYHRDFLPRICLCNFLKCAYAFSTFDKRCTEFRMV